MKQSWKDSSIADKVQVVGIILGVLSLLLVARQLSLNNKTNQVAIRGQLYDREAAMASEELVDLDQTLSTLWSLAPTELTRQAYANSLLSLVTKDRTALRAHSAATLFHSIFSVDAFSAERRPNTANLRRLFLYVQSNLYHVHLALDYRRDGILSDGEWQTWKNLLREAHAHPMLLTVIWHGYQNRYFSRSFGEFLQKELCPGRLPADVRDFASFERNRDFVLYFYPEMVKSDWPERLPEY